MAAIKIVNDIEYGRIGSRVLKATLYHPGQPSDGGVPAIVWIHGGAWWAGDRHQDAEWCQQIAQRGFVCLSIDYRLSSEAIFPAAIQDCKCALRYLRANAASLGVMPDKLGAWGPSAGGHLAALLGTSANVAEFEGDGGWEGYPSTVQAVCDWFGPTDFSQMSAFPSDIDHDAMDSPESSFVGGPIQAHPDRVQKANPITYISETTPPMLIAHGKLDRLVPFNQSELLYEALIAHKIDVIFDQLELAGHGGPGFEATSDLFERCIAFFSRCLMADQIRSSP